MIQYKENNDVSVFIVDNDYNFIYINEYDTIYNDDARFIMLTNEMMESDYGDNNTICISKKWYEHIDGKNLDETVKNLEDKKQTSIYLHSPFVDGCLIGYAADTNIPYKEYFDINEAKQDYNGYQHTMDLLSNAQYMLKQHNQTEYQDNRGFGQLENVQQMYPAAFAAYLETEELNGSSVHGYIPAIGQLLLMSENIKLMNDILKLLYDIQSIKNINDRYNKEKLVTFKEADLNSWSSTIHNDETNFRLYNGNRDKYGLYNRAKTISLIIPLFKLKI